MASSFSSTSTFHSFSLLEWSLFFPFAKTWSKISSSSADLSSLFTMSMVLVGGCVISISATVELVSFDGGVAFCSSSNGFSSWNEPVVAVSGTFPSNSLPATFPTLPTVLPRTPFTITLSAMSAAFLLLPNLIGVPSALNPGRSVGSVIEKSDRDERDDDEI